MKKLIITTAALVMLAFSSNAFAFVTFWDYTLTATFTNSTLTNGDILPDGNQLNWGVSSGFGQSSLLINESVVSGQVETYNGGGNVEDIGEAFWADSIDLTHNNNPIFAPSLAKTTLLLSVILDPFDPDNDALPVQIFDFNIDFTETPNNAVNPFARYDIFALLSGFPNLNFFYDAEDGDGFIEYFVNVFPGDDQVLASLNSTYAFLANVPENTLGFTTPEGQSTTLPFSFTISTKPLTNVVPEPSTILLMGAGLLGLASIGRRKARK